MSSAATLPRVRGKLKEGAPLAPLVWFKSGGCAEFLFEPADADDLSDFLRDLDPSVPVMGLGLGSNLIVRDGGVPGVVIRLGKTFAKVAKLDSTTLECGGGASGILVSSTARDAGGVDAAVGLEERAEGGVVDGIGQVSNVELHEVPVSGDPRRVPGVE